METTQLLRLPPNATREEIRRQYHRLAMRLHPDRGGDASKFIQLQKEYRRLTRPDELDDAESRSESPPMTGMTGRSNPEPSRATSARMHTGYGARFTSADISTLVREYLSRLPLRDRLTMPRLVEPKKRPVKEYLAAAVFTLVCALLLTVQSLSYTPGAGSAGERFLFCLILLLTPGMLAAAVGVINRSGGRVLYGKVVTTITLCTLVINPTWLRPTSPVATGPTPQGQPVVSASAGKSANEAPIAFRDVDLR